MQRIAALLLLIIISPLFLFLIILSLLLQGYPPFYTQKRVGRDRNLFTIYKLRSMRVGRITDFGRFLRKTGLDELPQLLNIIKGEMLFIGPRPLTPEDISRLGWDSSEFDIRWTVFPGITGPAQLSPLCSKENTWKLDEQYCKNHSLRGDFKIILSSVLKVFLGKSEVR